MRVFKLKCRGVDLARFLRIGTSKKMSYTGPCSRQVILLLLLDSHLCIYVLCPSCMDTLIRGPDEYCDQMNSINHGMIDVRCNKPISQPEQGQSEQSNPRSKKLQRHSSSEHSPVGTGWCRTTVSERYRLVYVLSLGITGVRKPWRRLLQTRFDCGSKLTVGVR